MKQVDYFILQVWLKISCFIVKWHPNETIQAVKTLVFADVLLCYPATGTDYHMYRFSTDYCD